MERNKISLAGSGINSLSSTWMSLQGNTHSLQGKKLASYMAKGLAFDLQLGRQIHLRKILCIC